MKQTWVNYGQHIDILPRDIDWHTVVELIIGQFFIKTVIFRGNYILLINREWGHYRIAMSHQGRGLIFPCNDRMDEINKLLFYYMAFSLWTWACNQLKLITGQQITLKKTRHLNELCTWADNTVMWHWSADTFLTAVN